ncbi:Choline/ethanolaminephosphotransferase 1 [Linum perenne]
MVASESFPDQTCHSLISNWLLSPFIDNIDRILLFAYFCIARIYIFTPVGYSSAKMGSLCTWITVVFVSGCDALACAFEAMAFGSTAMCGRYAFWFWVISAIPFYLATWESYFTNTLILPVVNGPTEGLMLIYLAHFFTAIVGAEWWTQYFGQSLPIVSWVPFVSEIPTFKAVLYLMIAFAVIPTIGSNVTNVHKVVQAKKGNMPLALAMGRMILAHLCDEPKGLKTNMCMSLLYIPLAVANALTAKLNDGVPLVDEFWVLLGYCSFTGGLYLHFATSVIQEITTALGINCFRITRKEA